MLHTALMVDAFLVRKWSSQGPTSTYQRLHLCQCSASHHRWQFSKSNLDESEPDMCFTLMANMGEGGHNQPVIKDRWGIRKLTPRECARLQGYDDSWFKMPELSNSQLYKQVGNSVTVPLVTKLAESILLELEAAERPKRTAAIL